MNPLDEADLVYIPNPLHQLDHEDLPLAFSGLQSIASSGAEREGRVGLGIYTQPNYITNTVLDPHKFSNNKVPRCPNRLKKRRITRYIYLVILLGLRMDHGG